MGRALVDPPAASLGVDDRESSSADVLEVPLTDRPLEPSALIDHLDEQTILVERRSQADLAVAVNDSVRDELADEQLRRVELCRARPSVASQRTICRRASAGASGV